MCTQTHWPKATSFIYDNNFHHTNHHRNHHRNNNYAYKYCFRYFFFTKWYCLRKKIFEMKMTTTGKWMNEKKRFFSIFSNDYYSSILFCFQYSRMHWSDRNNSNDSNNYRLGHWRKTRFLLNIFFCRYFFWKINILAVFCGFVS